MTIVGEVISTGCDWITVTTSEENEGVALNLWASQILKHQRDIGNVIRTWGMAGFNGFSCGGCQMGARNDAFMVRLSGEVAWHNWRKAYQLAENVTRLDWQVTYRTNLEPRTHIRSVYKAGLRQSAKRKRGPTVTIITSNDGSDTLYLGKRQSDVLGRLYNKGIESKDKHFANAVRAEVEYKGKLAKLVARKLAATKSEFVLGLNQVGSFFAARACALPFIFDP